MKAIIQQRLTDSISMDIPELVTREYRLPEIPNKTHAVIGMRRSGKTSFLYQKIKDYLKLGVDRSRLVYFNFEDERLSDMTVKDLHWISDEYYTMFPENRPDKVYFFFDEIQLIEGWETYVRRLMDSENVQIFISGSSSKMLSKEIASAMRGRSIETTIYPYSFPEFLNCHGIDVPDSLQKMGKQVRSLMENQLMKYLVDGGFPEAQGLNVYDRYLLLQDYVQTVIFRDIVERFNVTNINVLRMLIRHLIRNAGSRFTVNKFYNHLKSQGIKVGKTTLHDYLGYLQDVFLLRINHIHTESERKRMVNPMKPYLIDACIVAAFSQKQNSDIDHLLENSVFIELCRRNAFISYVNTQTGFEVDFYVRFPDGNNSMIQVAADISTKKTRERECRALYEAGAAKPEANLVLINISEETTIEEKNRTIQVIPAWKWMIK